MPAVSVAQQNAAGMDLKRIHQGKAPRNFKGASESTIRHFAETPTKGLPKRLNDRRRKIAAIRAGR